MSDKLTELIAAVNEYTAAVKDMHVVHGSTDVHNHGGIAGAAMTPHCAWECRQLKARLNLKTRAIEGEFVGFHDEVRERFTSAEKRLSELGVTI